MKSPWLWIALVAVFGIGGYTYWQSREITPDLPPAATAPPSAPPTIAEPAARTQIQHPLPEPAAPVALPPLAGSDAAMQEALAGLFGHESLARFFQLDDVARRFVVTIDNLPRPTAAQRLLPVKPVSGLLVVTAADGNLALGADNGSRYGPFVRTAEAVEARKLVAAYIRLYPLFQQAYEELGYPGAYFNDRLVVAIDDLLAAPSVAAPALVQPKVLYQFADPQLEALSAGQKMMVRMGPANAQRMKEKLRAVRRELVAASPRLPTG
jgi:hypothetical protein